MLKNKIRSFWTSSEVLRKFIIKYKKYYILGIATLFVVDMLDVIHPLIIKRAIDVIKSDASGKHLLWLGFLYLIVSTIKSVGRYYWRVYFLGTSHYSSAHMRREFFKHLTRLTGKFFTKSHSGDLMSLATNDIESIRMLLGMGMLALVDALLYITVVPPILFYLSPRLAIYTFITLPFIPFIMAKMSTMVHKKWEKVQAEYSKLTTLVHENISGVRINKSYNTKEFEVNKVRAQSEVYRNEQIGYASLEALFHPTIEFVFEIGVVVFVILGGIYTIEGGVTLGLFVAFRSYINRLTWPMFALGWVTSLYNSATASNKRIEEVTKLIPEVKEAEIPVVGINKGEKAAKIEFKNLTFAYGEANILENINLTVEAGTTLGIIGQVGCGKSTLVNLLPRLYEVPENSIFVNDIDIRKLSLKNLRQMIAFVPQEVFLFSDSIVNNIGFTSKAPDKEAVKQFAKVVGIYDEIERFPNQFETMLGEKGINVSGGQKQRLSIARALYANSPILILDDSFSSIDTEVEETILNNIRDIIKSRTTIIVSHRISTLKYADKIIAIDKGKIIEEGTHEELYKRQGLYYSLCLLQKEKQEQG